MTIITQNKIDTLLLEAIKTENAIKGTLQKYRKEKNDLVIIASEGFSEDFLQHFKGVKPFDTSCCGRAFGAGTSVLISNVEQDLGFKEHLDIAKREGFRAVWSIPIITKTGEKVGVISTHYKDPKWLTEPHKLNKILKELSVILEKDI